MKKHFTQPTETLLKQMTLLLKAEKLTNTQWNHKNKSGNPSDYLIFYALGILPIFLVFFKAF